MGKWLWTIESAEVSFLWDWLGFSWKDDGLIMDEFGRVLLVAATAIWVFENCSAASRIWIIN
jgi:hypothetical protein